MDIELSDQQLLVDRTTAMRMLGLKDPRTIVRLAGPDPR